MEDKHIKSIARNFQYVLIVTASFFFLLFFALTFIRLQYKFILDITEGDSLLQVKRILSGESLYTKPSLDYVPMIYTPLYFYLSAILTSILGIGFMPLRLISLLASLGCFLVIYLMVKKETNSKFSGFLATGLFVASFRLSGSWFDIAKPDSLFLFFLLTALYFIRFHDARWSFIVAGILFSLSFLSKQTALVIILPIILCCIYINWRRSLYLIIPTLTIIILTTLFFTATTDGWYNYYIFELPSQHTIDNKLFIYFWVKDLIYPLPIVFFMAIFVISNNLTKLNIKKGLFYLSTTFGMLIGSWVSRLHTGGYDNVLLPAYAILAILFGNATQTGLQTLKLISTSKQDIVKIYFYIACLIQFASLIYDPFVQLPTQKDLEAGQQIISIMSKAEGDVFIPNQSYLALFANKPIHAGGFPTDDVFRGSSNKVKNDLVSEIKLDIQERKFSVIILDSEWTLAPNDLSLFRKDLEKNYKLQNSLFVDKTTFIPVTGLKSRPQLIYIRISSNNQASHP